VHGLGRGRNDRQAVGSAIAMVKFLRRVDVGDVVGLGGEGHDRASGHDAIGPRRHYARDLKIAHRPD